MEMQAEASGLLAGVDELVALVDAQERSLTRSPQQLIQQHAIPVDSQASAARAQLLRDEAARALAEEELDGALRTLGEAEQRLAEGFQRLVRGQCALACCRASVAATRARHRGTLDDLDRDDQADIEGQLGLRQLRELLQSEADAQERARAARERRRSVVEAIEGVNREAERSNRLWMMREDLDATLVENAEVAEAAHRLEMSAQPPW
eukprot:m51a1_g2901 hypothetical protein (208) ;mRNA; r:472494-473326